MSQRDTFGAPFTAWHFALDPHGEQTELNREVWDGVGYIYTEWHTIFVCVAISDAGGHTDEMKRHTQNRPTQWLQAWHRYTDRCPCIFNGLAYFWIMGFFFLGRVRYSI